MKELTPRERMLTTLARKEPDRVPKDAWWTPPVLEKFKERTGADSPEEYFGFEKRGVGFKPTTKKTDFSRWFHDLPEGTTIDEWGVAHTPGSFYHFTRMVHPMRDFKSVKEIEAYPFPDLMEDYRSQHMEKQIQKLKEKEYFAGSGVGPMLFETAWYLRGMDDLLMDFAQNQEFAAFLLDKITTIRCWQFARISRAGADMVSCGDDVGMQDRMIMSPSMWRKWLKPGLAKIIKSARDINPGIHIFYHTDGYVEPIIPDLIEIGVDVLNPVQPECMDPAKLKQKYGDKLAFWGTCSAQRTMRFGTIRDVENEVKERIETVGKGGGLVITPGTDIEPDVPWENVITFFQAVEKYGKYR